MECEGAGDDIVYEGAGGAWSVTGLVRAEGRGRCVRTQSESAICRGGHDKRYVQNATT